MKWFFPVALLLLLSLAAVSSITPFPLVRFLLEDGFRPWCIALFYLQSLHPSLFKERGEESQGKFHLSQLFGINMNLCLRENVMRCCGLFILQSHHDCINTAITSFAFYELFYHVTDILNVFSCCSNTDLYCVWKWCLMHSVTFPSSSPAYDSCSSTRIFLHAVEFVPTWVTLHFYLTCFYSLALTQDLHMHAHT